MKTLHESVQQHIEKKNHVYATKANKGRKHVVFQLREWVWVHMHKERFTAYRKSKLHPRKNWPFQILERINDNIYKVDLPSEYSVSATKLNHAKDPLDVPSGPITRARTKKLKEALNRLVQNIWSKMNLDELETPREHKGQPLTHLIQVQEELNSCVSRGWCIRPHNNLFRLVFPNVTRIESQ